MFQRHVEVYRQRALCGELVELSGRNLEQKAFAAEYILSRLCLGPEDTLVDVGCGDGRLLRLAPSVDKVGFTATIEEAQRLSEESFPVKQSLLERIDLPSDFADVVVCHAVFS